MNIKNIIVIKDLQYFILSAVVIFAVLSLLIKNTKEKFIFLFLFILFAQIFDFTLYYGELFYLFFIPIILFLVIFYLYNIGIEKEILVINNEKKYLNNIKQDDNKYKNKGNGHRGNGSYLFKEKLKKIYIFITPVLFCVGFIFLFFKFSSNYTAKFNMEKNITLINFSQIAEEIYINYEIIIFLIVLLIFILFLWIISLISIRKKD